MTKISHHVNYIWDNRECQEPRGVSKFGGVKRDRNMMMKLRGYSRIQDRGGKVERSGEGRESMQRMQWWRSGRCLPLDAALPCMGHCETAPGGVNQPV